MEPKQKTELSYDKSLLTDSCFSILLVEDNPGDVLIVKELLKSSGVTFSLRHVSTLKETLSVCLSNEFSIILLDLGLPDSLGLETLKKIQVFNIKNPVIVMTGLDDEDTALQALREGAQDYLVKSRLTSDSILRGIKYGIERKKIQDLLKKNARQFSLLSSVTAAINESEDIPAIFTLTCKNISRLLEKAGVVAVESDHLNKDLSYGIDSIEPWSEQIRLITGISLNDTVMTLGDQRKSIFNLFRDGKLHKIDNVNLNPPSVYDFNTGSVKNEKIQSINIYAIGFIKSNGIFGGVLIFTPDIIHADEISVIETIGNQVSLCCIRKTIKKELRSSERRFRKLSEELELKVRERTHDLESSNYRLNNELIERHQIEDSLKKSEASLKELVATKDKFFNIIAHDLKNPFTCLIGTTELLIGDINRMEIEKIKELAQILNDSAKSGFAILQNLLDWSRSQTGLITYNPQKINLGRLIDENISDLRLSSLRKEIRLISNVSREMNIFTDSNMLNAILRNLLGNAIKFTHKFGTVEIGAVINGNEVIISIKDNGIGIPAENIKDLFKIDCKYTKPGTNMEHGTGLGLKLSKEFIEIQGGRIWLESVVNKGSTFMFSIPLKKME